MDDQYEDIVALAEVLRGHMQAQKLSVSQLAKKAGISKSTLSNIMSGKTSPYLHTLYQICSVLQIRVADVLEEQKDALEEKKAVLEDAQRIGITDEELSMILIVRKLPESKQRWLKESFAMLTLSEQDMILQ